MFVVCSVATLGGVGAVFGILTVYTFHNENLALRRSQQAL
jgi:hypothetical protein